jgi:hypothetical protein
MSDYDWTIEITPAARATISRDTKAKWDGRELGGALVGHTAGDRIVVTDANGIGIGVETPRGESWIRPSRSRWFDFARPRCDRRIQTNPQIVVAFATYHGLNHVNAARGVRPIHVEGREPPKQAPSVITPRLGQCSGPTPEGSRCVDGQAMLVG